VTKKLVVERIEMVTYRGEGWIGSKKFILFFSISGFAEM
jgi:hypothetical protein